AESHHGSKRQQAKTHNGSDRSNFGDRHEFHDDIINQSSSRSIAADEGQPGVVLSRGGKKLIIRPGEWDGNCTGNRWVSTHEGDPSDDGRTWVRVSASPSRLNIIIWLIPDLIREPKAYFVNRPQNRADNCLR